MIVRGNGGWRRELIVEAAVLVEGDDEQGGGEELFVPTQCVVDVRDESLARPHVMIRMVVVRALADVAGFDEAEGREAARRSRRVRFESSQRMVSAKVRPSPLVGEQQGEGRVAEVHLPVNFRFVETIEQRLLVVPV